jgi:hypothetical protein
MDHLRSSNARLILAMAEPASTLKPQSAGASPSTISPAIVRRHFSQLPQLIRASTG